jgi:hypothetical protein
MSDRLHRPGSTHCGWCAGLGASAKPSDEPDDGLLYFIADWAAEHGYEFSVSKGPAPTLIALKKAA